MREKARRTDEVCCRRGRLFTAVSRHLESLIVLNRAIECPSGAVDELSYLKISRQGSWVTAEDIWAFLEEPSLYEASEV
jgi:hypothetical protein